MCQIRSIILIAMTVFLLSCQQADVDTHETRFMMGTLVSFTVTHADKTLAKKAIRKAAEEMQRVESIFTIYGDQPNDIKAFNQSPINTGIHFTPEISKLLKTALMIERQSLGSFNPKLALLNKLWGFSQTIAVEHPPSQQAIEKYLHGTQRCLQQQAKQWFRSTSNCQLDFGAIAKGYAIDRGIAVLRQYDIQNAMINAGGDMRLIGKHGSKDWRIGIRDPRHKDEIIATLSLHGDVSIVTSGDYERYFMYQGQRYHHILEPKTGWVSRHSQSTTVIAANAMLADAWSTALFVAGKKGIKLAEKYGLQALIIDSEGHQYTTKDMPINLLSKP
ncbi:MAG: FAD:protein FMN transferase [Mariprofundaceae bacterium]|nr:FAD:protein FMN transferase [Mariprofundaceae bacterium]